MKTEDVITRAFDSIARDVEKADLTDNEKNAVRISLNKMRSYYDKKMDEVNATKNYFVARGKLFRLQTEMVENIVALNDIVECKRYAMEVKDKSEIVDKKYSVGGKNYTVVSINLNPNDKKYSLLVKDDVMYVTSIINRRLVKEEKKGFLKIKRRS